MSDLGTRLSPCLDLEREWKFMNLSIMALFVQGKLKKVKPSAKNAVDKYKEVLDQTLKECRQPAELRDGLETFLTAGKADRS